MVNRPRKKRPHERSVRLNVTLPAVLASALDKIVHEHGFTGPCAYIHETIRRDAGLAIEK